MLNQVSWHYARPRFEEEILSKLLKLYEELLYSTPVGFTFPWAGGHKLVCMMDCGRRYAIAAAHPVEQAVAA